MTTSNDEANTLKVPGTNRFNACKILRTVKDLRTSAICTASATILLVVMMIAMTIRCTNMGLGAKGALIAIVVVLGIWSSTSSILNYLSAVRSLKTHCDQLLVKK